tara:strand:+ start:22400 stop:23041 length:642 start_codon:yes stop_codon:yes gene_type:complete
MLSLKFPPLEKLLDKNTGELEEFDPKRGICIFNGNAVVVNEQSVLFFDLESYFVNTNNYVDDQSLNNLKSILDFMEGKMFSAIFWKELTSLNIVSVSSEGLMLNGSIEKNVFYKEKTFDETEIKLLAKGLSDKEDYKKAINAMYMEPLYNIFTALKPMIKMDSIILRTIGENTQIQFTFNDNHWITGFIVNDGATASKNFLFDPLNEYLKDIL